MLVKYLVSLTGEKCDAPHHPHLPFENPRLTCDRECFTPTLATDSAWLCLNPNYFVSLDINLLRTKLHLAPFNRVKPKSSSRGQRAQEQTLLGCWQDIQSPPPSLCFNWGGGVLLREWTSHNFWLHRLWISRHTWLETKQNDLQLYA